MPSNRRDGGVGHDSSRQRRANPLARGLSALQQWIVREVQARGQIEYDEIRREYFGWETRRIRAMYLSPKFRTEIDPKVYNRVNATLSRTIKRLVKRGLVQEINHGVRMPQTPEERQADLDEMRAFEAMFATRRAEG
jgi:hypothetical protein